MEYSDRINSLSPYQTDDAECAVRLYMNESPFNLPESIREEIAEAVKNIEFNRYPDPEAKLLCESFARFYNIDPAGVVAGNGSDELLGLIISAFLDPSDKLLTITPDFSMYDFYSHISGGKTVKECRYVDTAGFCVDTAGVLRAARENGVKLIVFSNPGSPTGMGMAASEVMKLASEAGCAVVCDEAYMDFWDQSVIGAAGDTKNLIVTKTASKAVGIPAARIGFSVSNAKTADMLKRIKSPYNTDVLAQTVGSIVYGHKDYLKSAAERLCALRDRLFASLKTLEKADFVPFESKTNFIYVKTARAPEIFAFLKDNGILVRQLSGALRITVGTEAENEKLLAALKKTV